MASDNFQFFLILNFYFIGLNRLVAEILNHFKSNGSSPSRISFVAHSLGTIVVRTALSRPQLGFIIPRLHTYLSLSGPHLGILFNNSGLVNMGMNRIDLCLLCSSSLTQLTNDFFFTSQAFGSCKNGNDLDAWHNCVYAMRPIYGKAFYTN